MFGLKTYNYEAFTRDLLMKDMATDRFSGPEAGDRAPDFETRTLDGDSVRLSDYQGEKNVVLTFGSATCPFTAATIAGINKLAEEVDSENVQFLFCYVREAHPGERLAAHDSMEQKVRAAEILRDEEDIEIPIIVDDLKGTIHKKYGKLPNATYIIDKSGRIAFRSLWTRPAVLREALKELLEIQEARGVDHAVVMGGQDTRTPTTYAMLHTHRALRRGGKRAIHDFGSEMGWAGRFAVQGSRVAAPIAENPGIALFALGMTAGVITGAVFLGRWLRQRRYEMQTPYDRYQPERKATGSDYEAVGI